MDVAKTMAEGGKEVVGALDKRIADVTAVINVRGAKLAESISGKIDDIDKALGVRAMEVAENLDIRIGRFEELLIGRAEAVTKEIEARSQSAAELLTARTEHLSSTISTNASEAAHALEQTTAPTVDVPSRAGRAAQRRHQDQHQRGRALDRQSGHIPPPAPSTRACSSSSDAIKTTTADAERTLTAADRAPRPPRFARARMTPSGLLSGHVDRRQQRAQAECRRGRAHPACGERRGCAQFRWQGRRDLGGGEPARGRDDPHRRREVERTAHRADQQEPGVRQRGEPGHRARGQGDRGQGLQLHPDDDGQQRADRAPDQRGERDRDRSGEHAR